MANTSQAGTKERGRKNKNLSTVCGKDGTVLGWKKALENKNKKNPIQEI